jgi:23S rRNA (cytosine1962-C5)-methyltransferase
MWLSDKWADYELLDCSGGEKLERWGQYILVRPDPQAIWNTPKTHPGWFNPHARYTRSSSGGGQWGKNNLPESWQVQYGNLQFNVKPMNFKHTGLFPEQAANWDFLKEKVLKAEKQINVLNLFAYTGGATVAAAEAGAAVCHVDASRGMVAWARENARASGLEDKPVRWIIDDCAKFLDREIRRGKKYDALIMDPPSYGRGPSGEVWKLEDDLYSFVKLCADVLSEHALFVIINSYTTGLSPATLTYIAETVFSKRFGGSSQSSELGLPVTESGLILPCGAACRWEGNW